MPHALSLEGYTCQVIAIGASRGLFLDERPAAWRPDWEQGLSPSQAIAEALSEDVCTDELAEIEEVA